MGPLPAVGRAVPVSPEALKLLISHRLMVDEGGPVAVAAVDEGGPTAVAAEEKAWRVAWVDRFREISPHDPQREDSEKWMHAHTHTHIYV